MHFRRYAQHQLAAGRLLRVAPCFFAGGQVVGHGFFKNRTKLSHVVGMKTHNISDASNMANVSRPLKRWSCCCIYSQAHIGRGLFFIYIQQRTLIR